VTDSAGRVVVAGLGNEYRGDDGVGPLVATRAVEEAGVGRDIGPLADPLDLLGAWDDADLAIVVDAVRSGSAPGTLCVVDLSEGADADPPTGRSRTTSSHGIGLASVLRLARAVGHAPSRLVVVGIEGERFGWGIGLSPAVAEAVPEVVRRVVELMGESRACV
jgi:hydrogenase maturation protease